MKDTNNQEFTNKKANAGDIYLISDELSSINTETGRITFTTPPLQTVAKPVDFWITKSTLSNIQLPEGANRKYEQLPLLWESHKSTYRRSPLFIKSNILKKEERAALSLLPQKCINNQEGANALKNKLKRTKQRSTKDYAKFNDQQEGNSEDSFFCTLDDDSSLRGGLDDSNPKSIDSEEEDSVSQQQNLMEGKYESLLNDWAEVQWEQTRLYSLILRKIFIPRPGYKMVGIDYCQIEMRILAHFSNDQKLIELFNIADSTNNDFFICLAGLVFKKPDSEVTAQERADVKQCSYAVLYGMGKELLKTRLMSPIDLATNSSEGNEENNNVNTNDAYENRESILDTFINSFSELKLFRTRVTDYLLINSSIFTIKGHRRPIATNLLKKRSTKDNNSNSSNVLNTGISNNFIATNDNESFSKEILARAKRQAFNSLCQGTAATLVKEAMVLVFYRFVAPFLQGNTSPPVRITLQLHDELIFEVREDLCFPGFLRQIKDVMESVSKNMRVPLRTKVKIGENWAEMKDITQEL